MQKNQIAIIGAGAVGSTTAYALMLKNIPSHITLVDPNTLKCKGEVLDLSDTFMSDDQTTISYGTIFDARKADIILITAGERQKPDQPRNELFAANKKIVQSILADLQPLRKDAIIIMVSNPVDQLALVAKKLSGLPDKQIIGSGTFLDTQRLREELAKKFNVSMHSIEAYVLGEHGDSQFVPWSLANIAGKPLLDFDIKKEELEIIAKKTRNKAYEIITSKGSTYFGIASSAATLCKIILADQKCVIPVSSFIEKYQLYLSLPAILGRYGIESIVDILLSQEEQKLLDKTVQAIHKNSRS